MLVVGKHGTYVLHGVVTTRTSAVLLVVRSAIYIHFFDWSKNFFFFLILLADLHL